MKCCAAETGFTAESVRIEEFVGFTAAGFAGLETESQH